MPDEDAFIGRSPPFKHLSHRPANVTNMIVKAVKSLGGRRLNVAENPDGTRTVSAEFADAASAEAFTHDADQILKTFVWLC